MFAQGQHYKGRSTKHRNWNSPSFASLILCILLNRLNGLKQEITLLTNLQHCLNSLDLSFILGLLDIFEWSLARVIVSHINALSFCKNFFVDIVKTTSLSKYKRHIVQVLLSISSVQDQYSVKKTFETFPYGYL